MTGYIEGCIRSTQLPSGSSSERVLKTCDASRAEANEPTPTRYRVEPSTELVNTSVVVERRVSMDLAIASASARDGSDETTIV